MAQFRLVKNPMPLISVVKLYISTRRHKPSLGAQRPSSGFDLSVILAPAVSKVTFSRKVVGQASPLVPSFVSHNYALLSMLMLAF
jgi:hypothetical protein